MLRRSVGLLVAVLMVAVGSACGGDADSSNDAGEVGIVTGQEFPGHQLREIPADGAPAVTLQVQPDEHGGWTLRLLTEGFTFTPERNGGPARAGQGHAHVYVDGEKFSRAYGEWFFLPAQAAGEGEHTVLVTLNADDHTVWAAGGEPITAEATITATADGHGHAGPTAAATTPASAVELFEFTISGGRADPPLERAEVQRGATVRIVVSSDRADEVHLHGYDRAARVGPGEEGVIEFVADQTGLFELETHETPLVLLQLQVR